MALPIAMFLVDEIDLDISNMGTLTQVILSNKPVEIDWRSRACVDLVIADLLYRCQMHRHFVENAKGLFHRCSFRHVQNNLKFRLVIEGQHFHDYQL